ncbi:MAG: cyclic nucleotide-binding domain-containing protein, partial [Clostridia bacterium]|nr:cyclic nucleotide-binding domain-containing protein [Clostridia bacterium]
MQVLKNSALFCGISDEEIAAMLGCLGASEAAFGKGQYILRAGDAADAVGLLLSGSALVVQEDYWGNRNIIGKLMPSDLFAEAFACSPGAVLNVAVIAEEFPHARVDVAFSYPSGAFRFDELGVSYLLERLFELEPGARAFLRKDNWAYQNGELRFSVSAGTGRAFLARAGVDAKL